jgi:homeobox-leucine zipper protein
VGACSELIFAPIDDMFPEDAPLVPSGFRIVLLNSQPVESRFFVFDFSLTGTVHI